MSDESNSSISMKTLFKKSAEKIKTVTFSIGKSIRRIFNQIGAISLGFIRSPALLFWTILLPIILVLLFGAMFGNTVSTFYQLPLLDLDESDESIEFQQFLITNSTLSLEIVPQQIEEPIEWLKENNKIILLIIPESWGGKVNNSIDAELEVYYDPSSTSATVILEILEEAVIEYNFDILAIEQTIGYEIDYFYIQDFTFIDSFIPGVIMIIISIIALITNLSLDIEEKESGMLKKFETAPIKKFEWVFAKQIWQIFIVIIASTIAILFALIFDFHFLSLNPLMLLFIIFGTLTFSGLAMVLIRFIKNPEGVMLVSVLILIPQIFLSGALIPIGDLPQFLQIIARAFPLFYLTESMKLLMLDTIQQQFWLYFFISLVFAIAFFSIGIIVTKWRDE